MRPTGTSLGGSSLQPGLPDQIDPQIETQHLRGLSERIEPDTQGTTCHLGKEEPPYQDPEAFLLLRPVSFPPEAAPDKSAPAAGARP